MTNRSTQLVLSRKRRWLRFSLRGLLIVVFLLAVPLAWLGAKINTGRRETAYAAAVWKAGGQARFDYNAYAGSCIAMQPKGPWLLRAVLGKNIFSRICLVDLSGVEDVGGLVGGLEKLSQLDTLTLPAGPQSDELIDSVARLSRLQELTLNGSEVTPLQMRRLLACDSLGHLELRGASAADEILAELAHAEHLSSVSVISGTTTDDGMKSLSEIKSLYFLEIRDLPAVTNQGFQYLAKSPSLELARIRGTQITEACVGDLTPMANLKMLEISPGTLNLRYKSIDPYRLDTGEAVRTPLFRSECWPPPPKTTLTCCVDVEANRIRLDQWDVPMGDSDE